MSVRSAWVWGNAAWREALRGREAFVDVDVTRMAPVVPRANHELDHAAAGSAMDWRTPAPVREASSAPPGRGRRTGSLRLEHWVCAPLGVVRDVAADLEGTDRWLTSPEGRQVRVVDGRHEARVDTGVPGGPADLVLTCAAPGRVRWETWWGGRYGGSHTVDLAPLEGGTLVGLTREITFGHLAAALMPPVRFATGLGMPWMTQNLAFACADLLEEEPS